MSRFTSEAICIRHWDFSETSQTVSLFSRDRGVIRGLAKGSKREKSRFSGGIELLTRGRITAITKPGRELATLTEWDLEEIFPAISRDLRAYYAGMYFADLAQQMVSQGDTHPRLFDAMVQMLRGMGESETADKGNDVNNCNKESYDVKAMNVLGFQWAVLCETGYRPILDEDAETGGGLAEIGGEEEEGEGAENRDTASKTTKTTVAFSARAGGVVADTGAGNRWRVRSETIALLRKVAQEWDGVGWVDQGDEGDEKPVFRDLSADSGILRGDATGSIERANRLLAAYLRTILDRELPTMKAVIGEIGL